MVPSKAGAAEGAAFTAVKPLFSEPSCGAADGAAGKLAFLGRAAAAASLRTRREAGTIDVTVLSCSARGILTTVDAA